MITVLGELPHNTKSECESVRVLPKFDEVLRVTWPTLGLHLNEIV